MRRLLSQWTLFVLLLFAPLGSLIAEESRTVLVRAQVRGKVVSVGGSDYVKLAVNGINKYFYFTTTYDVTNSTLFEFEVDLNDDKVITVTQAGMSDYRIYFNPVMSAGLKESLQILLDDSPLRTIGKADISGSTVDLRVRPVAVKEPVSAFGKAYPVIGATKAEIHIGLGRATMGYGAGKIMLKPENFGANNLATTDAVFSIFDSTYVDVTSSGTHRQAFAPEGLADVQVLGGGGFAIKFYTPSQVGAKSGGLYPLTGSPVATYEITDPDTSGGSGASNGFFREFKLKRIIGAKTDYLEVDEEYYEYDDGMGDSGEGTTTYLYDWYQSTKDIVHLRYASIDSYNPEWQISLFTQDGSANVKDAKEFTIGNFESYARGYGGDLYSVYTKDSNTTDPSNPYEVTWERPNNTTKTYRFTGANLDGEPDTAIGQIKQVKTTFKDTVDNLITSYSYWEDASGELALPDLIETKQGSLVVGKTTAVYTEPTLFSKTILQKVETNYSESGEFYITTVKSYRPDDADEHLKGKTISIELPNGTKTSYLYLKGTSTWDISTSKYVFTPGGSGAERRVVTLHGNKFSGGTYLKTFEGYDIDDLDMETVFGGTGYGKHTAEDVWYDAQGRVHYRATYVYIGSGNFAQISHRQYIHDGYGNLVKDYEFVGSPLTDGRIFHVATYANGQKTSESDAQGVITEFYYDAYDRVIETIKKGITVSGFDTQGDIETTYTLDVADNVLTETVHDPSSTKSLTTTYTYDTGGRVKTVNDPRDLTNTYSYTSDTVTTVTYPNNSTRTTTLHKDGRLYTITGTAQPPETYTYGYESGTGFLWSKKAYDSGPWNTAYKDWLGRPIRNEFPTFNSSTVKLFQEFQYDNTWSHLTKETYKSGTSVGSASTVGASKLYWYDGNAKLTRTATDTNDNGSIDLSTDHNVMEYYGHFQKFGSDWYDFNGYGTYGTDGSSTLKGLEATYAKVSGYTVNTGSDSTIGYSFTQNIFGDYTEDYVKVRRSQAKVIKQHYIDQNPSTDLLVTQSVNLNGLDVETLNTEGHLFSNHYDVIGRLILTIDGRDLETEYSYDSKGQLSWVEDSAGVRKTYLYDSSTGFMFKDTDDSGIEALYGYDLMGRLTHTYGRTPYPVRYEYNDPMGQMTKMETFRTGDLSVFSGFNGTSDETNWTYDSYTGLLKKKTDDKLKYSEYTYNSLGQVLTRRDGRGVIVTNEYYASTNPGTGGIPNALKKVTYPSTGGYNNSANVQYTPDLLYTYKRHGGLYEVTEGSTGGPANKRNKRVFSYDSNYQLSQEDLGIYANDIYHETNDVINYTYDTTTKGFKGRSVSFNYRNDSTYKNSFTYDSTSRLDKVTANHFSATAFDYTYNAEANVVDYLQYGNYKQDMVYRSDSYRLDKILHLWASDSSKTQETRLEYDSHGRRTYEKMKGTVVTTLSRPAAGYASKAEYDLRSQVNKYERYNIDASTWAIGTTISNTRCDWVFDNEGNRDHETIAPASLAQYTANELNLYTLIPGASPTHDDNGNMLTDGTRTMVYDAENRLVKVTIGANNWTYQYDYMGRRITLSANGTLQKKFVYQGWNLIAETNSSDTVGRKFTWGLDVSTTIQGAGGVGGLLMIQDGSAEYYPIYDGARNIVGLYNETGGIAAAYEYDAYGRIVNQSGTYAASNPFRFSTKYTDEDTDLVYYGLRYYNPKIGRFINRDPIGESGGINLNAFVGNNPVNYYDYLGLHPDDPEEDEDLDDYDLDPWEVNGWDAIDTYLEELVIEWLNQSWENSIQSSYNYSYRQTYEIDDSQSYDKTYTLKTFVVDGDKEERGNKVPWNSDNKYYVMPPLNWPETNLSSLNEKTPFSLLGTLWKANPRKLFMKLQAEIGRVEYPIGNIPEYTADITIDKTLIDVVFGYTYYMGGPSEELPYQTSFEISGLNNGLWGNIANESPYSVDIWTVFEPVFIEKEY